MKKKILITILLSIYGTSLYAQNCPKLDSVIPQATSKCERLGDDLYGVFLAPGIGYACAATDPIQELGYRVSGLVSMNKCNQPTMLQKLPYGIGLNINLKEFKGGWVHLSKN